MQTKIIYEDDHVLVCHKPAGLATQSGRVGQPDVVSELKKYLSVSGTVETRNTGVGSGTKPGKTAGGSGKVQPPYLGVVHRLDQPVEGLLVFAKTQKAAAHLTKQLGTGSLNKQYYAVVCGKPAEKSGELVDYLVKDGNVARVTDAKAEDAKKAVLQYLVVCRWNYGTGEVYVLDVHIDTGRFHQIRVQLSHAGLPLLSDSKYGSADAMVLGKKLGFRNVALFAYKLDFVHPVTSKKLSFKIQPEFLA